jgi:hypothetical protein
MKVKSENFFYEPHLQVPKSKTNLIPSEKEYTMVLTLRCGQFPICDVINNKEVVTKEVETIIPVRINVCNLTIHSSTANVVIELSNNDEFWRSGYNTTFCKNISKLDIEYLSKTVAGKTISIGLQL